jgi:hypothetical protein
MADDDAIITDEVLDEPEEGLAPPPEAEELPVVEAEDTDPPPLGRSWAFDFAREGFVRGGRGPTETRGVATLLLWIDKCLHTERGALAIHPPGFGIVDPMSMFGRPIEELSANDLEERIRDALTFHPRIADVQNLELLTDPASDAATAVFDVLTDPPTDDAEMLSLRLDLEDAA